MQDAGVDADVDALAQLESVRLDTARTSSACAPARLKMQTTARRAVSAGEWLVRASTMCLKDAKEAEMAMWKRRSVQKKKQQGREMGRKRTRSSVTPSLPPLKGSATCSSLPVLCPSTGNFVSPSKVKVKRQKAERRTRTQLPTIAATRSSLRKGGAWR